MRKSIIAAVASNGVIGKNNDLVWHMPEDLKWFVRQTKGKWVILGRKSWESLGKKALPGRTHIIVTRNADYEVPLDIYKATSLTEGYRIAEEHGADELMILGGAKMYEQALEHSDRLIITEIKESFEGDAFFPAFNKSQWVEVFREEHQADHKNPHDYAFVILERKV
jgi:dihydrofolate reductase